MARIPVRSRVYVVLRKKFENGGITLKIKRGCFFFGETGFQPAFGGVLDKHLTPSAKPKLVDIRLCEHLLKEAGVAT